jgi:hypothetical protein
LWPVVPARHDWSISSIRRRLGYYEALDAASAVTSAELAATGPRNATPASGWSSRRQRHSHLRVLDAGSERRFALPAAYREVFLEPESLNYFAGVLRLVVGATSPFAALEDVYRRGGGVPYVEYGADTLQGIAAMNRPMFLNQLVSEWLPALPDIHARLQIGTPAWVADVGCGTGWSSIYAQAYPACAWMGTIWTGISRGRPRQRSGAGCGCVSFAVRDAADPVSPDATTSSPPSRRCAIARPVEALRRCAACSPRRAVLVADENVGERFSAPATRRAAQLLSACSALPATMAESARRTGSRHRDAAGDAARPRDAGRFLASRCSRSCGWRFWLNLRCDGPHPPPSRRGARSLL